MLFFILDLGRNGSEKTFPDWIYALYILIKYISLTMLRRFMHMNKRVHIKRSDLDTFIVIGSTLNTFIRNFASIKIISIFSDSEDNSVDKNIFLSRIKIQDWLSYFQMDPMYAMKPFRWTEPSVVNLTCI